MEEVKIEEEEINRILEIETDIAQIKIKFADLEIQKLDEIENLKVKLTEKMNYLSKLKKKYGFTQDNFTLNVENKILKF